MALQNLKSLTDIANMASGASHQYLTVPLSEVVSKEQVRKQFLHIDELAASMKAEGQQSPIIVSPKNADGKYVIQKGERRWRALKHAGLKTIDIIVRAAPKNRIDEIAGELIENIQRDDLKAMEVAEGIGVLLDEGLTRKEIATRVGKSATYVSIMLALRKVPKPIQDLYDSGLVSDPHTLYHLKQVWDVDEAFGVRVCNQVKKHGGISRNKARDLLKSIKEPEPQDSERAEPEPITTAAPRDQAREPNPNTSVGDPDRGGNAPALSTAFAPSSPEEVKGKSEDVAPQRGQAAPSAGPEASTPVQSTAAAVFVRVEVDLPAGPAQGLLLLDRADTSGEFGWVEIDGDSEPVRVGLGNIRLVELRAAN